MTAIAGLCGCMNFIAVLAVFIAVPLWMYREERWARIVAQLLIFVLWLLTVGIVYSIFSGN